MQSVQKVLNVNRRISFLASFVLSWTLHMNLYPKIVVMAAELDYNRYMLVSFSLVSYSAMTALLVLGIIPLKKFGNIKDRTQLLLALIGINSVLLILAISSIIIPIFQMTAPLYR